MKFQAKFLLYALIASLVPLIVATGLYAFSLWRLERDVSAQVFTRCQTQLTNHLQTIVIDYQQLVARRGALLRMALNNQALAVEELLTQNEPQSWRLRSLRRPQSKPGEAKPKPGEASPTARQQRRGGDPLKSPEFIKLLRERLKRVDVIYNDVQQMYDGAILRQFTALRPELRTVLGEGIPKPDAKPKPGDPTEEWFGQTLSRGEHWRTITDAKTGKSRVVAMRVIRTRDKKILGITGISRHSQSQVI